MGPPTSGWEIPAALTLFAVLYGSVHPWVSRRFQAPLASFIKCASVHRRNRLIFHRAFATLLLVHSIACGFPCQRDHRRQLEQGVRMNLEMRLGNVLRRKLRPRLPSEFFSA